MFKIRLGASWWERKMSEKDLIGKTIKSAKLRKIPDECEDGSFYDDEPFLDLEFTDGSKATIIANYGGYTGKSDDEYPRFIEISVSPKESETK